MGAVKGAIAIISDKILNEGTTIEAEGPIRKESRSAGFLSRLIIKVSKEAQQPGPHLYAAAGTRLLPAIPQRLQHCPLPYKLPQKPTVTQGGMKDTWED